MTAPQRVQMSRQHPWRADHPDAVIVTRPSKWGNPFNWQDIKPGFRTLNPETGNVTEYLTMSPATAKSLAALQFRNAFERNYQPEVLAAYPSRDDIIRDLRGKDLACWCGLNDECHADVLLEIANGEVTP
jgi:hypothetical protein